MQLLTATLYEGTSGFLEVWTFHIAFYEFERLRHMVVPQLNRDDIWRIVRKSHSLMKHFRWRGGIFMLLVTFILIPIIDHSLSIFHFVNLLWGSFVSSGQSSTSLMRELNLIGMIKSPRTISFPFDLKFGEPEEFPS